MRYVFCHVLRHAFSGPAASRCRWLAAALLLISTGCSTPKIEAEALPFRVAIAPLAAREITSDVKRPGRLVDYRLKLSGHEVADAIAQGLNAFAFSEVVALGLPRGVNESEFETWLPAEKSEYILAEAKARGADVILTGEVLYSPVVRYTGARGNEFLLTVGLGGYIWIGIPVATILGAPILALVAPVVAIKAARWYSPDRKYAFDVSIDGTIHDAHALLDSGSGATLMNRQAELVRLAEYVEEAKLRFNDRATSGGRALTLIRNSRYVGGNPIDEHRALRNAIVKTAIGNWIYQIKIREDEMFDAPRLVPFDVQDLRLERDELDQWHLHGDVRLDPTRVDVMDGYSVRVEGEALVEYVWIDADYVAEDGQPVFAIRDALPNVTEGTRVQLEIRDGALRQGVRTFTLVAGVTGVRAKKALRPDMGAPPRPRWARGSVISRQAPEPPQTPPANPTTLRARRPLSSYE